MNTPDSTTVSELGERQIIAEIRARLPAGPSWLRVGVGDDAAVVEAERGALEVLTTDALVEGVHFDRRFSSAYDVGWKALAVNVSDVAAMGGQPRLALLSLALPSAFSSTELHALIDGFFDLARETGITLAGGNVTRSPGPLMVDVTLTGSVRPRRVLTRSGASAGDELYVTGFPGAALAGLSALRAGINGTHAAGSDDLGACIARYRRPEPRARIGLLAGRNRAASACMDLSDGLADAITQMAEASGVGAIVDAPAIPMLPAARRWFERTGDDPVTAALSGGDDYELLFAIPRRARGRFATVRRQAQGVPVTRIGALTEERAIRLQRGDATEPLPAGFVHF